MIERSRIRFLVEALLHYNLGQVVYTLVSPVIKGPSIISTSVKAGNVMAGCQI